MGKDWRSLTGASEVYSLCCSDIGTGNIVMDGFHLFEDEPHPSDAYMRIDFAGDTQLRPRHTALPSYHFIDFGLSTYNPPGTAKILYRGVYGQDVSVPEFQDDQVVDPFKADLWSMGRFLQVYITDVRAGDSRVFRADHSPGILRG